MRIVQLDQNLTSRKLIKACGESGEVAAIPLPERLKGMSDSDLLRELVPLGRLIVTNDRGIVAENTELISSLHPGFLIVMQDHGAIKTMTWKITLSILHAFKAEFQQWADVPWSNSVLNLRPSHIELQRIQNQSLTTVRFALRTDANWQTELEGGLRENALLSGA